jgi:single-strand selective monofunctional uracil DNA glycosylase
MTVMATDLIQTLISAARRLRRDVDAMSFTYPITHCYNPLNYAWKPHQAYLQLINPQGVRVVFLGMNPGPWGMAQTGVPFGEINAVRDWIGIDQKVEKPANEHPKRPILGMNCQRSEVSGRRLWGLFQTRFASADKFFADHFVINYCPLVFMERSGRNRTPDKLPLTERQALDQACDRHLQVVLRSIQPEHVVGVGAYAEACLQRVLESGDCHAKRSRILHPSPASPAANKDWAGAATRQLIQAGVW